MLLFKKHPSALHIRTHLGSRVDTVKVAVDSKGARDRKGARVLERLHFAIVDLAAHHFVAPPRVHAKQIVLVDANLHSALRHVLFDALLQHPQVVDELRAKPKQPVAMRIVGWRSAEKRKVELERCK